MLRELHIENLAIIDTCTIEFDRGFNILTGATGAGKSIVVGALSLILGERASADDLRSTANQACVEARFELAEGGAGARWLIEADLVAEEGELIVRRQINRAGRSRCTINGRAATLGQLRELGRLLVDLHGQHQHQALLQIEEQLTVLDQFSGNDKLLAAVQASYRQWLELRRRWRHLARDEREIERRKDTLRFQVEEIDQAALAPGEDQELTSQCARLRYAEKLSIASRSAYDFLYEGELADLSVSQLLGRVNTELDTMAGVDSGAQALAKAGEELAALIDDLAAQVRDYADGIEANPHRLELVEERLQIINRLKRKYGATLEEILAARDAYAAELDSFEHGEEELGQLRTDLLKAEAQLAQDSLRLSKKRRNSTKKFAHALIRELEQLHMPQTLFEAQLTRAEPSHTEPTDDKPAGDTPWLKIDGRRVLATEQGIDRVEFMLSPNPGEELKPLKKIASGGELSRIMLALKSLVVGREQTPTMVFDEIDVGISGAAAERVGEKMNALGRAHQIIGITHLPQIAAKATAHLLVEKRTAGGRTTASVQRLTAQERVAELARLMSGAEITDAGIRYAQELIED